MLHIDLFSGIGGFSLGLERAGHETIAFCEIDPYCQKVLAKHWPNVDIHDDIRKLSYNLSSGFSGIVTAGFPCQDISCAGKRQGIEGERSGLWSELARVLGELRPHYAIMENVSALLSGDQGRWFGRVLGDLAEIGYDCEWHCIPASYLGAPHRRDRIWIVAYPSSAGRQQESTSASSDESENERRPTLQSDKSTSYGENVADANSNRWEQMQVALQTRRSSFAGSSETMADAMQRSRKPSFSQCFGWRFQKCVEETWNRSPWQSEPDVGRVANGVPARVDRLRCLGNAIVPQMAELIGRAIKSDIVGGA